MVEKGRVVLENKVFRFPPGEKNVALDLEKETILSQNSINYAAMLVVDQPCANSGGVPRNF